MKSWKKLTLGGAAAALLLALLAVVALRVLYPPAKIKSIALEKIQTALGREVRIETASVGLGGVSLEGLEVSDLPDFKTGKCLSAGKVRLAVPLVSLLLKRELRVNSFVLDDWSVRVVRRKDGSLNVSQMPEKPEDGSEKAKPAGPDAEREPMPLEVRTLSLTGGTVEYVDEAAGTSVKLTDTVLEASDLSRDRAFPATLGFKYAVKGTRDVSGSLRFSGTVDPGAGKPAAAKIDLAPLEVALGKLRLRVEGSVRDFTGPEAELRLSVPKLPEAEVRKWVKGLPKGLPLPAALNGTLSVKAAKDALDLRKLELKSKGLSVSVSAKQTPGKWELGPSRLSWGGSKLELSGSFPRTDGVKPAKSGKKKKKKRKRGRKPKPAPFTLKLKAKPLFLPDIAAWAPPAKAYKLAGKAFLDLTVAGTGSSADVSGTARLAGAGLTAGGQTLSGLKGKVTLTPARVRGKVSGKLGKGDLSVLVDARNPRGPKTSLRIEGSLSVLDLSSLPEASKKTPKKTPQKAAKKPKKKGKGQMAASGKLTIGKIVHPKFQAGESRLNWALKGLSSDPAKLNGSVDFRLGDGSFKDLRTLAKKKPMLRVVLMPLLILQRTAGKVKGVKYPKFDEVTFKDITGNYVFSGGRMSIKESHMDTSLAYVKMTGTADLVKDRLDLKVSNKLLIKQIRGPIGFKVKGSLSNPQVKLDAASILKQPEVEKALKKGQDFLKGLFKKRRR